MVPATAVAPIILTNAMERLKIKDEAASGSRKWKISSRVSAPSESATSRIPLSISSKELSTSLAIYGAAKNVSDTITALGPIALPTRSLVTGISKSSKTTNGSDLIKLITISKVTYNFLFSYNHPFLVKYNVNPRKKAINVPGINDNTDM